MYVVYELTPDGDSITLFNDLSEAKDAFDETAASSHSDHVVLAEVTASKSFGFGAMGDFFGGSVIFEHWGEDESESPLCGACGGDATICDGC
jgi:hypothetical protein